MYPIHKQTNYYSTQDRVSQDMEENYPPQIRKKTILSIPDFPEQVKNTIPLPHSLRYHDETRPQYVNICLHYEQWQ